MRELTIDEMDIVSGGELWDGTVTASRFGGGGTLWSGGGSGPYLNFGFEDPEIVVTAPHADPAAVAFADAQVRNDVVIASMMAYLAGGALESLAARLGATWLDKWLISIAAGSVIQLSDTAREALWSTYYRQAENAIRSGGHLGERESVVFPD